MKTRGELQKRVPATLCGAVFGCFLLFSAGPLLSAQAVEPDGGGIEKGTLPDHWMLSGPKCMEVPDWQVHEYNPDLYIIRQSGCLDYEKPFLYLIFGQSRALLLDTGSRNFPAKAMVENVVGKWLTRNHQDQITLVVAHTHAHSDHVAGDDQLKNLHSPSIKIQFVPPTVDASKQFYGIADWPEQVGQVDLGGRVLDSIPIPGHNQVSMALYDRKTAILFTGDSLYPGRLYVQNWSDFVQSTARLVAFTKGKLIAHILGCHIEQTTTPYLDYPVGTIYQPHEHALAMSHGQLLELDAALSSTNGKPAEVALRDFTIWPVPPDSQMRLKTKQKFDAVQKEQLQHMWDQPPPSPAP